MSTITGTWRNGQIQFDEPADFPEGCRVRIEPLTVVEESLGIREEDWPTTPEAKAEWLQWFDAFEAVELTPEDQAAWDSWRRQIKEYTIANTDARLEGLFE
jgi:hypothetical protein